MTKIIRLCIVIFALASNASAEFTPAEKAELVKFHQGRIAIASGIQRFATMLIDGKSEEDRPRVYSILANAHSALRYSKGAHERFLHEPGTETERSAEVAEGLQFMSHNSVAAIDAAKAAAAPWMGDSEVEAGVTYLDEARALFLDVDQSLGYLDWQVASYPRVVGPHGDYVISLGSLNGSGHYLQRSMGDAIRFYGEVAEWPSAANEGMHRAVTHFARAHRAHIRARGLDAEIVLDDDRATIEADVAASSGLRPFDFFRVLLEFEYIFGHTDGLPTHAGRTVRTGVRKDLIDIQLGMTTVLRETARVNFATEMIQHLEDGNQTLATFFIDFADFWARMDRLGIAWMGFFHEIPSPPGGVTCGAGTVLQGGECVAMPPACPVSLPEAMLGADGVLSVRCVE